MRSNLLGELDLMNNAFSGYIRMMSHTGLSPVQYTFNFVTFPNLNKKNIGETVHISFALNELLGTKISLKFTGEIRCVDCGKVTKKSFNGGSCYKCFISLASNDLCILKPTLCHFENGTCREPDWGKKNCFKKHIVYLANSTGIKVGITKENPYSKRWVDQGAISGLPIFEVESRKESGVIEEEFAKFISDKSSWQKLISEDSKAIDLKQKFIELKTKINWKSFGESIKIMDEEVVHVTYPIHSYPLKKVSLKPDPSKPIEGKLIGIKGQYLLFEGGGINIRSLEGHFLEISW
jgi:hypothetical protein